MQKIRNVHFMAILIPNNSYKIYHDDVTMTSFININFAPYRKQCSVVCFLCANGLGTNAVLLRCIKCVVTRVLYQTSNICLMYEVCSLSRKYCSCCRCVDPEPPAAGPAGVHGEVGSHSEDDQLE